MANRLGWCAFSLIQIIGTMIVMSQVAWEVFFIFIPVTYTCYRYQVRHCYFFLKFTTQIMKMHAWHWVKYWWCLIFHNLQQYYIPTARELARLAGIQRSPILHHFAESLAGAATIRAFEQKDRFTDANLCLIDNHSRPWFHNVAAMEWLSFRLNQLSNFVFAFSLVLLVTLPEGFINPSM